MTTPLTSDQAIALLRKHPNAYDTAEKLRALAAQVDADSPGRLTVLYSGRTAEGVWSSDIIKAMESAGEDVRIIDSSQAAKFMTSRDFYHAVARAYGVPDFEPIMRGTYRGPATDWLYHPTQGPWADASARFADATVGEVRAIASDARPDRVFGATEVPHILSNPKVTTIEGVPREMLAARQATHGTQAAFEMIAARAYDQVGQLRVAVNYAGTPLRENNVLSMDSRAYFLGTSIEGKVPMFTATTLPLSDRMGPPGTYVLAGQQHWNDAWSQIGRNERVHLRDLHAAGVAGKGLGVLAAAATVYDLADTTHDVSRLRGQGNATAAEDRITRFATQNVGGWGGAGLGGMAGGAVGNAPGAVLGLAVGGIAGAVAGDKVADWLRDHKINHQQDAQGQTWTFDPDHPALGWARTERTVDMAAMERAASEFPIYQTRTLTADPALSDRLTYQASCRSIELALGAPPPNRDPYRLPVAPADATARLPFETGRAWIRDPQTEQWQQSIEQRIDGRIPSTQVEPATPSQAAALERQSQAILLQNTQHTPAAMASQFQAAYERNGWSQHGPMPAAVTDALRHPDRVVGSDGQTYERNTQGQWTHDGLLWDSQASGNLRHELEGIHQRQSQAHAQEPVAAMSRQAHASEAAPHVAPMVSPQGRAPHRTEATPQPPTAHGRLDDPHHPDHAFYLKTRELVHRLDEQNGRTPDQRSDQLASALTVSARNAGLQRIDQVALSQDANTLWGAQRPPGVQDHFFDRHCQVNTVQALHMPMEQSGAQWPQAMQQFQQQEQTQQQQQVQQQSPAHQQGAQMIR